MLGIRDTRHPVSADLDDDVADLVQQSLLAFRLRQRLVAGAQRPQRPVQASQLFVDFGIAVGFGGATRYCVRWPGRAQWLEWLFFSRKRFWGFIFHGLIRLWIVLLHKFPA